MKKGDIIGITEGMRIKTDLDLSGFLYNCYIPDLLTNEGILVKGKYSYLKGRYKAVSATHAQNTKGITIEIPENVRVIIPRKRKKNENKNM